ncbi:LysR family transcriptional regulator [Streptomyces griseiscabiei]|uniref:LysR family transcriptional regulator n=1 Tax=Streptomyces griseiscabiei TaxID=2993540 RepID=A0ABU4LFN7_9ACTN|nr:LysR family transcriptional regulator [Streptomyces griseiscabiei]MBZ3900386.1 LysR family transcriptional regulator [Streptomyces griseiscabiei]MDX2914554.1 LysR family transcriptional regulator [Streptomyces griseiscabiei]
MEAPSPAEGENGSEIARLSRVDLNLLVHLQVLLEERSVTRAAARIGLTQPAMSHSLNRCRRLIGDDLLMKVGTTLELTPRGRALLGPLRRLLHAMSSEVLDRPGFVPAVSRRRFRISASSSTIAVVLGPLLRLLDENAPGVSLQVVTSPQLIEDLSSHPDLDLVLLPDGLATPLPRERLLNDEWVAVLAPDNAAVTGDLTVDHLRELPHVVFENADMRIPPYSVMDALGIDRQVRARCHDFLSIPLVVASSKALAVVQKRIALRFQEAGLVQVFPLPIVVPPLGIDMVWNPRLAHDPACAWLREQLLRAVTHE